MVETRRKPGTHPARWGGMLPFAIIILSTSASHSEAQFGYGIIGLDFQHRGTQSTNFLDTWSLNNAAAAAANRPQPLTAPRFQSRDEGFNERYDLATREAMVNRIARDPRRQMSTVNPSGAPSSAPTPPTPQPAAAPQPRPVVHLANFFDQDRRLVWPAIAPITGSLGRQQQVADQAILAVLNEYELQGLAHLSNVTEARQRLLDYGRPALDYVRGQTTPAMSDSFHAFLLSLYSNVGLAATVARAP